MYSDDLPESLEGALDEAAFLEAIVPIRQELRGGGDKGTAARDAALRGLFSVQFTEDPDRRWVRPLDEELPEELREALAEVLFDALRFPEEGEQEGVNESAPLPDLPSAFRVELVDADAPTLRLRPSVRCRPLLRNRTDILREAERVARRLELGSWRGVITLFVDEEGQPTEHRIEESHPDPRAERDLVRLGMQMRFEPASVDGFPVAVWVTTPLSFTVRR